MMDPDVLRRQLTQLHEELGLAKQVDPRSVELLTEIMEDIKRLTESSADPSRKLPPVAAPPPIRDRLEEIAARFEARHPVLASSTRRLVDLLGSAGL